jgi:hypothetical protein
MLNEVVESSRRLTILIVCEGQGEIIWTPYNDAINRTLKQNYSERKKNSQPFVVLLRVQNGKYFGCTVNFPPGSINFPAFVPEPEPAATNAVAAAESPRKPPALDTSPLIVVGSKSTNAAVAKTEPPVAAPGTNPAAPSTNLSKPVAISEISHAPAVATPENVGSATSNVAPVAATLPPAAGPAADANKPADKSYTFLIAMAGGALVAAGALVIFLMARARRPHSSLITDSLNAPKLPPRRD